MNLREIQKTLKAPKGQYNTFGKYKYRSCEDILEAVKPLLEDSLLTLSDEMVMVGERFYVKATVTFIDGVSTCEVSAYAREPANKKGMDEMQITGAASSYARKYALNGLFCIDDAKDADDGDDNGPMPDAEIISKMIVMLEENTDGKKVSKAKLEALVWDELNKYPITEDEARKTVNWLIKKNMLGKLTEKK